MSDDLDALRKRLLDSCPADGIYGHRTSFGDGVYAALAALEPAHHWITDADNWVHEDYQHLAHQDDEGSCSRLYRITPNHRKDRDG